jgi:hypothetical protein
VNQVDRPNFYYFCRETGLVDQFHNFYDYQGALEVNKLNTYSMKLAAPIGTGAAPVRHRRVAVLINNSALLKKIHFLLECH